VRTLEKTNNFYYFNNISAGMINRKALTDIYFQSVNAYPV
jgi:hypothetical protein